MITGSSTVTVSVFVTVCVLTSTRVLSDWENGQVCRTVPQEEAARTAAKSRKIEKRFFIG